LEPLLGPNNRNKKKVTRILQYHIARGRLLAAELPRSLQTLGGFQVLVDRQGGEVLVGNAKLVLSDLICANGVIHIIEPLILAESKFDWKIMGKDHPKVVCAPSGGEHYWVEAEAVNAELLHLLWNKVVLEHTPTEAPPVERTAIDSSPDAPE